MVRPLFLLILGLWACTPNRPIKDDYSEIISFLLKTEFEKVDLLILDTEPVSISESTPEHNKITRPYLELYARKGFIKHEDINHILEHADSLKTTMLDSAAFTIKTMTRDRIDGLFSVHGIDSTLDYLHNQYNIQEIGSFSTPLFSKDKSVIIFWAKTWRNPLSAHGYIFIFRKDHNKWKMIESGGTFES